MLRNPILRTGSTSSGLGPTYTGRPNRRALKQKRAMPRRHRTVVEPLHRPECAEDVVEVPRSLPALMALACVNTTRCLPPGSRQPAGPDELDEARIIEPQQRNAFTHQLTKKKAPWHLASGQCWSCQLSARPAADFVPMPIALHSLTPPCAIINASSKCTCIQRPRPIFTPLELTRMQLLGPLLLSQSSTTQLKAQLSDCVLLLQTLSTLCNC